MKFGEWWRDGLPESGKEADRDEELGRMVWDAATRAERDRVILLIDQDSRIDGDVKRELVAKIRGEV